MISTDELAPWVGKTAEELREHPFALAVIAQASDLVREAAKRPEWGVNEPAPVTAKNIVVQVSQRVFNNPRMIAQRGAGPITEKTAQELLTGMDLTPGERERLYGLRPSPSTGLWVVPTETGRRYPEPEGYAYIDDYGNNTAGISEIEAWRYHLLREPS